MPVDRERLAVHAHGDPGALLDPGPDPADPGGEGADRLLAVAPVVGRAGHHRHLPLVHQRRAGGLTAVLAQRAAVARHGRVGRGVRRGGLEVPEIEVDAHRGCVGGHRDPADDQAARELLDQPAQRWLAGRLGAGPQPAHRVLASYQDIPQLVAHLRAHTIPHPCPTSTWRRQRWANSSALVWQDHAGTCPLTRQDLPDRPGCPPAPGDPPPDPSQEPRMPTPDRRRVHRAARRPSERRTPTLARAARRRTHGLGTCSAGSR